MSEEITPDLVGKRVETAGGEAVGEVTAVEDGKAILEAPTGGVAALQETLTDDERLALEPSQIRSVTDERVTLDEEPT